MQEASTAVVTCRVRIGETDQWGNRKIIVTIVELSNPIPKMNGSM